MVGTNNAANLHIYISNKHLRLELGSKCNVVKNAKFVTRPLDTEMYVHGRPVRSIYVRAASMVFMAILRTRTEKKK